MAATDRFIYFLAFTLLFTLSISSDPPQISPSPPPQLASDDQQPSVPSPSPTATAGSPPAPPPSSSSDLAPAPSSDTSSSPLPSLFPPAPAPAAEVASDVSASNVKTEESEEASSSSGGMSSGKKVGIAFGVIGAACAVVFGGMLYRKRQYNIRRAEFSAAARTEFL